jgi:hypothetical protein
VTDKPKAASQVGSSLLFVLQFFRHVRQCRHGDLHELMGDDDAWRAVLTFETEQAVPLMPRHAKFIIAGGLPAVSLGLRISRPAWYKASNLQVYSETRSIRWLWKRSAEIYPSPGSFSCH